MITCYFEDKHKAYLRHVVMDAIVISRGKILLVKRSKTAVVEPNKYVLPGGFLERDENTSQAVVREVLEETGYKARVKYLFEVIDKPDRCKADDRQNVGFVYVVEVFGKRGNEDKKETAEVAWFGLDNLPKNIGFDHREIIELFMSHLKKSSQLPVITS